MPEPKTRPTSQDPREFLSTIAPAEKQRDSFVLLDLMQKITGEQAVMWGPSIVGFGSQPIQTASSKQAVDWPMIGFSPRKQNLTLYVMAGNPDRQELLDRLGKHTTSVACLYIKRLSDVDQDVLATLIESAYAHTKRTTATAATT